MRALFLFLILLLPLFSFGAAERLSESNLVLMKNDSPLIAFRILIRTGSASDPKGKEGVADLTASLLAEGSTQANDYQKILELLFPMAAGYDAHVDKELTVFTGVAHKDHVTTYYSLLRDAILSPAFKQDDFDRVKTDQLNYLTRTLRYNNDEELGREVLSQAIYPNHPYGHPVEGLASSVKALTLQDVKDFYANYYTQRNLWIGITGDFPAELVQQMRNDFGSLPAGKDTTQELPAPAAVKGQSAILVEKQTDSTSISFGFPITFTRADDDYYPMMVVNSWLGQHRNSFAHLYQVMREVRGLNYGDYSYIEYFPARGRRFQPPPNVWRRQQFFEIWIRPVENLNRHFALRQAIRELQLLIDHGMTSENFELARNFLQNNTVSLALSGSDQLGYALDDRLYGLSTPFLEQVKTKLAALKLEDVNAAIRKHFSADNLIIAAVTQDAAAYKDALAKNTASPIKYNSPKPEEIMNEDKAIESYPLKLDADRITVIPVDKVFE